MSSDNRLNPYNWDLDSVEFAVACRLANPPIGDATRYPEAYSNERIQFNTIYEWCKANLAYDVAFAYHNIKTTPTSATFHWLGVKNTTDDPMEVKADISQLNETTDTFEWSFTSGLKLGASWTGRVGLPLVAGGEMTVNAEITVEMGVKSTKTKTVQVYGGITPTINLPAHMEVTFESQITNMQVTADFITTVTVRPRAGAQPPPPMVMNYGTFKNSWQSTFGSTPVTFVNQGSFKSAEGVSIEITISETPLPGTGKS